MLQDQRPDSHTQSDGDLDIKQHMPAAFFVKGFEHPVDQRSKDDRADDNGQGSFDRSKKDSFNWFQQVIASDGEDL